MYCYNCGEKLIEGANFCHNCGADQTKVELQSKKKDPENIDNESTKIYKIPKKEDEQELVDYIHQVDANIEKEVEDKNFNTPKKEEPSADDKINFSNKFETNLKTENTEKNPKRSFKEIWDDFIDESDNPYSIFSELDASEDSQDKKTEEQNNMLISDNKESSRLDTSSYSSTGEVANLTKRVNEILAEQEAEKKAQEEISKIDQEEHEDTNSKDKGLFSAIKKLLPNKKITEKDTLNKPKKQDSNSKHDTIATTKIETPSKENKESKEYIDSDKEIDPVNTLQLNKSTEPSLKSKTFEEKKMTDDTLNDFKESKYDSSEKSKLKEKKLKETPEKIDSSETYNINQQKNKKDNIVAENKSKIYYSIIDILYNLNDWFESLTNLILKYDKMGIAGVIILGLIFTIIPFVQSLSVINSASILLIVLKIFISYFNFYYASFIASENTNLFLPKNESILYSLINWTLLQLIMFICFQFYPRDAAIGFNLLGALTPRLWSTLILYILAILIAVSSIYDKLPKKRIIDYTGWYAIIFICIELISKLIWVVINFISSTLL